MTIEMIQLDRISGNPWQTRSADPDGEYIAALAVDIFQNGLLQTPMGRRVDGRVQIAFGHNRLAAYKKLAWVENGFREGTLSYSTDSDPLHGVRQAIGRLKEQDPDWAAKEPEWASMPVDVRGLTDEQMAAFAWSENEKRRDITAIERARAIERRLADFGWTNRQAGEALGIDHSTISNILRLLKLPEELQQAIQEGKLSERQAMAIVVLFELPEFSEDYWQRKVSIISDALSGAASDKLRRDIDGYLKHYGKPLEAAEFSPTHNFPENNGVYCGLCGPCDKRMASRNLCFDEACYLAKTRAVRLIYLANASLKTGYPVLDWHKEGYPTSIPSHLVEKIKATKCPNLVLEYGAPSDKEHAVSGFPKARLVCEKRNQSCSCVKGLRANTGLLTVKAGKLVEMEPAPEAASSDNGRHDDPIAQPAAPTSKDLEEAARQARRARMDAFRRKDEVMELVVQRLAEGLRDDNPGAFCLAANRYAYPNKIPDVMDSYRQIAHELVNRVVPGESDSVEEMLERTNGRLESLGLEAVRLEKTLAEVFGTGKES